MEIAHSLLSPNILKLQNEFNRLENELSSEGSEEALELKNRIESEMREFESLKQTLASSSGEKVPTGLYVSLRKIKLNLRFAQRTRLRLLSNGSRKRTAA